MKFFILILPILVAIVWALYCEYRRKYIVGSVTLTLIGMMTAARFITLALHFSGHEMGPALKVIEDASSMYIVPTMYMYLCHQCGTRWNNHQAIFMVFLPILAMFSLPPIEFSSTGTAIDAAAVPAHSLSIFSSGQMVYSIGLRPLVVIIQCLTVGYCMGRLWFRVRNYGLTFSRPMTLYYIWMFLLLGFMTYSHIIGIDTHSNDTQHVTMLLYDSIVVTFGFALIPSSFMVSAPLRTQDDHKPVHLDSFVEKSAHLANHLHQLMEDDCIYLQPGLHIDDLAAMMGTNRTYVTRLMQQEFGQTFVDYINNARIIYSKRILLTTSLTLEDIASKSGFASASAYCRVFRRMTGTTPMAWKNEQNA